MAKKKVFISFDYDHDLELKKSFVSQARHRDSQFSINDSSLIEPEPDVQWVAKAKRAIRDCDVFLVILGPNTHSAPGVRREVDIAMGLNKDRFQLVPQRKNYGEVGGAGPVVKWKWRNLEKWLSTDVSRVR